MLTYHDLEEIEKLVDERLDEKLKYLPTKDEFYKQIDIVIGRLDKIDKNVAAITYRSKDHADRLETIEGHLGLVAS